MTYLHAVSAVMAEVEQFWIMSANWRIMSNAEPIRVDAQSWWSENCHEEYE